MSDKQSYYFNSILPTCMHMYQHIEELLRQSIIKYHKIIEIKTNDVLSFRPPVNSVESAPMGKLIQYFTQYNENEELINLLKNVKNNRNHIAHQSYLITYHERQDEALLVKKIDEASKFNIEALECFSLLFDEGVRLNEILECLHTETPPLQPNRQENN